MSSHCSEFIPPRNNRRPKVFWRLQGVLRNVYKRETLGWNEWKSLTCFSPMFPFYTPWKHQKPKITSVISGGIKWEHHEKAWNKVFDNINPGIHYE